MPPAGDELLYRLYFAIKSILGRKSWTVAAWPVVVCRAFGCFKVEELPESRKQLFHELTKKDSSKKKWYLRELQSRFNVQHYAKHTRGYYWGIGDSSKAEKLVDVCFKKKLKQAEANAAQKALEKQYMTRLSMLRG